MRSPSVILMSDDLLVWRWLVFVRAVCLYVQTLSNVFFWKQKPFQMLLQHICFYDKRETKESYQFKVERLRGQ